MILLRRNGFSLAEVLIVLCIIGILTTMAAYGWQRYVANSNLRAATRGLESDLFFIKERAISERVNYRIILNIGANNYTINQETGAGTGVFTTIQTRDLSTLYSGVTLLSSTFPSTQVTFQPRGTLSGAAGSIVLKNTYNYTGSITINLAGRTHVEFAMQ